MVGAYPTLTLIVDRGVNLGFVVGVGGFTVAFQSSNAWSRTETFVRS